MLSVQRQNFSKRNLIGFHISLLTWYAINKRDFPWRYTQDPYKILIAEKLLQQTLVRPKVVEVYEIIKKFPAPKALAQADVEYLVQLIQPLGLTYRAKELIALTQIIVKERDGYVPVTFENLMNLPGVGQYCSRAILSFAHGHDICIVDTNVARFLFRLFGITGKMPANPVRKRRLIDLAQSIIPIGRSKDFNLAILDLCALVCTVRQSSCDTCPVREYCWYGSTLFANPHSRANFL